MCMKHAFLTDAQLLGKCNSLSLEGSELRSEFFFKDKL